MNVDNQIVALGMALAYGPVILLILARNRLGSLRTATFLVLWGALLPTLEHAGFAMGGSREIAAVVGRHTRYHFFMAGIFTVVAGIMIAIVAATQLRQGKRPGWYAILIALIVGGGFELSGAAGTLFHGFPPSWAMGLGIYAYPLAWASALAISYRPIFENKEKSHERPKLIQSSNKLYRRLR
jgi:hypothetical protein